MLGAAHAGQAAAVGRAPALGIEVLFFGHAAALAALIAAALQQRPAHLLGGTAPVEPDHHRLARGQVQAVARSDGDAELESQPPRSGERGEFRQRRLLEDQVGLVVVVAVDRHELVDDIGGLGQHLLLLFLGQRAALFFHHRDQLGGAERLFLEAQPQFFFLLALVVEPDGEARLGQGAQIFLVLENEDQIKVLAVVAEGILHLDLFFGSGTRAPASR